MCVLVRITGGIFARTMVFDIQRVFFYLESVEPTIVAEGEPAP
jgi:hypothetical protein